jgi:hypothetical protein
MHRHGIDFQVTVDKLSALAQVLRNREQHARLVKEAREGYRAKAMAALQRKMAQLSEGRTVGLGFQIPIPRDCTAAYDTAIAMLEAHVESVVVLKPEEFRHLMLDQWDWTDEFAMINAAYSPSTRAWGIEKGIEVSE